MCFSKAVWLLACYQTVHTALAKVYTTHAYVLPAALQIVRHVCLLIAIIITYGSFMYLV